VKSRVNGCSDERADMGSDGRAEDSESSALGSSRDSWTRGVPSAQHATTAGKVDRPLWIFQLNPLRGSGFFTGYGGFEFIHRSNW
jgi:hypothetical protein